MTNAGIAQRNARRSEAAVELANAPRPVVRKIAAAVEYRAPRLAPPLDTEDCLVSLNVLYSFNISILLFFNIKSRRPGAVDKGPQRLTPKDVVYRSDSAAQPAAADPFSEFDKRLNGRR